MIVDIYASRVGCRQPRGSGATGEAGKEVPRACQPLLHTPVQYLPLLCSAPCVNTKPNLTVLPGNQLSASSTDGHSLSVTRKGRTPVVSPVCVQPELNKRLWVHVVDLLVHVVAEQLQ